MRPTMKVMAMVITGITLATSPLAAQANQSPRNEAPRRLLVVARPDSLSQTLATAVRSRLASDGRYEVLAERMLTAAERPVDVTADSTLTQQRALARILKAEAFIGIDAARFAETSSILAYWSVSDSGIFDVVSVPSGGSPTDVARTLVERVVPKRWASGTH